MEQETVDLFCSSLIPQLSKHGKITIGLYIGSMHCNPIANAIELLQSCT